MALSRTQKRITNIIVVTLFVSSLTSICANNEIGPEKDQTSDENVSVASLNWNDRVTVQIKNGMGDGIWIGVHCKSRDDDIGFKILRQNKSFSFSFEPNIWGTTLFQCYFTWKWDAKSKQTARYFNVYADKEDRKRCKPGGSVCCWEITRLGPCDCDTTDCYSWKKS